MSLEWAERQRRTNRLVRRLARHVFDQKIVGARQLFGLSKLTWITNSYASINAGYIASTKIPALGDVVGDDLTTRDLNQVACLVSQKLNDPDLHDLILGHSGFTNFYKPYRNSVQGWVEKNRKIILAIYMAAYEAKTDEDRLQIVRKIGTLTGIPKANHPSEKMRPEYFLTPILFSLDQDVRFPIINGNERVKTVLKILGQSRALFENQYKAMTGLYGYAGIQDAADLDQLGASSSLENIAIAVSEKRESPVQLLKPKKMASGKRLPIKDETDIESVKRAGTVTHRRIHNQITNKLIAALHHFTLIEGNEPNCRFDIMVTNYNGKNDDLMIEAKSSTEPAQIRMAVGQLFNYWFAQYGERKTNPHVAVLLPECPDDDTVRFLKWLDVGLLWLDGDHFCTQDHRLRFVAKII